MSERERAKNTSELVLNNLRQNLNIVVAYVLGDGYYNLGADVYKADEIMCEDLLDAYEDLKKEIRFCTFLMLVMFFFCIVLLYMGINHMWIF